MGGHTNFAAEVIEEKQKVFQWIRKWLRENDDEKRQEAAFDLPDLIILLQCAGFTLQKFESETEVHYTNTTSTQNDCLKIEMSCSKSGMRAEMAKSVKLCKCPKPEDIKTEEFFSVTSCAPTVKGNFDVSLCPFLPSVSHPKRKVIGDIFGELVSIISSKNDLENDPSDVGATIERLSLDPTKSLMQNLKDIKRVVDSFLGDKEEEGASFLRRNMPEKLPVEEKSVLVPEKTEGVEKAKSDKILKPKSGVSVLRKANNGISSSAKSSSLNKVDKNQTVSKARLTTNKRTPVSTKVSAPKEKIKVNASQSKSNTSGLGTSKVSRVKKL